MPRPDPSIHKLPTDARERPTVPQAMILTVLGGVGMALLLHATDSFAPIPLLVVVALSVIQFNIYRRFGKPLRII